MKRESKVWGVSLVLIFLFVSIVSLLMPCRPEYFGGGFFGGACSGDLIFSMVNLPLGFFIYFFYQGNQSIYENLSLTIVSLVLNSVMYFFVGVLLGRLIRGRK